MARTALANRERRRRIAQRARYSVMRRKWLYRAASPQQMFVASALLSSEQHGYMAILTPFDFERQIWPRVQYYDLRRNRQKGRKRREDSEARIELGVLPKLTAASLFSGDW